MRSLMTWWYSLPIERRQSLILYKVSINLSILCLVCLICSCHIKSSSMISLKYIYTSELCYKSQSINPIKCVIANNIVFRIRCFNI